MTNLLPFGVLDLHWSLLVAALILFSPLILFSLFVGRAVLSMVWRIIKVHILRTDIYDHLPVPRHPDWRWPLFGHFPLVWQSEPAQAHLQWIDELKSDVYVYRGLFYDNRLMIGDARGIMHILSQNQCYQYPKPESTRIFLRGLLGDGILSAEGHTHRRQRKIVSPAFSVSSVRAFTGTFFSRAHQLVRMLEKIVDETQGPAEEPFIVGQSIYGARASCKQEPVFDISVWLAKVTLDIIGDCGFGHDFKSLESAESGEESSLAAILTPMFKQLSGARLVDFITIYLQNQPGLSWIRKIPTKRAKARKALYKAMERQALAMISEKRAEIAKEMEALGAKDGKVSKALFDEDLQTSSSSGGKDLLHLTIRANMASDVKEADRLDDDELLGQMTSFLLAGHETTSTMTQWALFLVSQRPDIVQKLRSEIEETFAGRDEVGYDELSDMQYLDCVAKEMMRLYAPITSTLRTALNDSVVPLGSSYPTRDGKSTFNSIKIPAGSEIIIPIQVLNSSKSIWGPTAREFDPSRWLPENLPRDARDSGLPLHLATFIAGPRGCVGNRFAIAEFKVLLVTLIRSFDFARVPGWEIKARQEIVTRCKIEGQEEVGTQMPLRISRRGAKTANSFPPNGL
ncbi:unnamed protein product [Sympodiomycopsis kandeliae]